MSDLDAPCSSTSVDDLQMVQSSRNHRRQRRASSDILKSPKSQASSLFSKLSFSTELLNQPAKAMSRASLSSNQDTESESGQVGRVSRWQISFDAVLDDELGRAAFGSFLRKEFSEENLLFWEDCVKLEQMDDEDDMRIHIQDIVFKFISSECNMPINLPDELSKLVHAAADHPHPNILTAQKEHIYKLMKMDPYGRFLRAALFCKLLQLESDGRYTLTEDDVGRIERGETLEPKKKDKRKSTFQKLFSTQPSLGRKSIRRSKKKDGGGGSASTLRSSQSSGSLGQALSDVGDGDTIGSICHIHFSDGGSTTIAPRPGMTARQLLTSVAQRRGLSPGCIDWLLLNEGTTQETSLSLENDSSCLSGRQIRGELRVTFRLDIVHIKRSIGIRSKIHKPVSEVLQPIMARYLPDTPMQEIIVRLAGTKLPVNLGDPVSTLKEQRVVLEIKEPFRRPKLRRHMGETGSVNLETRLDKLKRRRESITGMRKRSRSRDTGLNRLSTFDSGHDKSGAGLDLLKREELESNRLSVGGKGQIDNQRGLLNKDDLVLPDFLRDQNENDDFERIDDSDEHIPSNQEAENIFGSNVKSSSSLFSNAASKTSSCSLFQDLTNQEKLNDILDFEETPSQRPIKRTSLTKADLIDLPSPPKMMKRNNLSPPKTSIV